jgi:hypothetical protein
MEEDDTPATAAAEHSVVSPLTRDIGGELVSLLGNHHMEQKLEKLPRASQRTNRH